MQNKLLPCPFCGGEAKIVYDSVPNRQGKPRAIVLIRCKELNCTIRPKTQWCINEEEAINHWNTRKPMERIAEQLEEFREEKSVIGSKIRNAEDKRCYGFYELGIDETIEIVKGGVDNAE